jgi:N-acetylglucosaminylphosphatidylinositol deacetylase
MSTSASALLITAHPDDEAMFFTPTILSLIDQGYIVHLLCLSTGAYPIEPHSFQSTPLTIQSSRQSHRPFLFPSLAGNADGLGSVRKQELRQACTILGIHKQNITIVDDPRLQDGMHTDWPTASIIPHITAALDRIRPSKVS